MYTVLSHITIQPQRLDEFLTLIRQHAEEFIQNEPGTLRYDVVQDQTTANHFYLVEGYADEAAFQAHMQGPTGQRNFPQIIALVSGPVDNSMFLGMGYNITSAES